MKRQTVKVKITGTLGCLKATMELKQNNYKGKVVPQSGSHHLERPLTSQPQSAAARCVAPGQRCRLECDDMRLSDGEGLRLRKSPTALFSAGVSQASCHLNKTNSGCNIVSLLK